MIYDYRLEVNYPYPTFRLRSLFRRNRVAVV
jgi:hypothetical protein